MSDRFTVAFAGDTSFGENYQDEVEQAGGENILKTMGRDYCLEKVTPLLRGSDLVIANLETPLTSLASSPLTGLKTYVHWSDVYHSPEALLRNRVGAVSLANNHTLDFGTNGLEETLAALDAASISWFGAGLSAGEASRPFRRDLPVGGRTQPFTVLGAFEYRPYYKRRFSFYAKGDQPGVYRLSIEKVTAQIVRLKQSTPGLFLVAYPHWGENYRWRSPEQVQHAHALVDAGADLVIGHGSHMVGEIEHYNGAWIVYSIGNFVFNAPGRYADEGAPPFSFAAQLVFEGAAGGPLTSSLRLYPILSDNQTTRYQPRFVDASQMAQVLVWLRRQSPPFPEGAVAEADDTVGRYVELRSRQ